MIPHRKPSFLIAKSSPKQINPPAHRRGFLFGAALCRRVTPHCAGAASPRRNHSEPGAHSPDRFHEILRSRSFRSMRSRYGRHGTAVSSGRLPSPALPAGYLFPTQKDPARWRGLFYSGRSRISCASAGSRWERDRTRSSHKAEELLHCHRSHRVSGRCPSPHRHRILPPTQKGPTRERSLTGTKSGLWATGTAAKRLGDTLRASCIVIVLA